MPKLIPDSKNEPNLYENPKNGRWAVRKYVKGRGELYRELEAKTRASAIREKDQAISDWLGTAAPKSKVTFDSVAFEVLDFYKVKAYKTYIDFEGHLRLHLLPFFAGMAIGDAAKRWEPYKAWAKARDGDRKLKHDRAHFRTILNHAYEQELIGRVPKLKIDSRDRKPQPGRVYSPDEVRAVWNAAGPKWKLILEIAAIEGMRRGEIYGLRKDQIVWDKGLIVLEQSDEKRREGRILPLEPRIAVRLREWCDTVDSPYVFPHRDDPSRPMTEGDKTWQRIKKRAGVKGKFHWFRHSNVSWSVAAGHVEKTILKTRGMSAQVMDRVYHHVDAADGVMSMTDISDALRLGINAPAKRSRRNRSERPPRGKHNDK